MFRKSRNHPKLGERGPVSFRPSGRVWVAFGGIEFNRAKGWPHKETLRKWVRQSNHTQGLREGLSSDEGEHLKALELESREVRHAKGVLRRTGKPFSGMPWSN